KVNVMTKKDILVWVFIVPVLVPLLLNFQSVEPMAARARRVGIYSFGLATGTVFGAGIVHLLARQSQCCSASNLQNPYLLGGAALGGVLGLGVVHCAISWSGKLGKEKNSELPHYGPSHPPPPIIAPWPCTQFITGQ